MPTYQNKGNKITDVPLTVLLSNLPDLQVTAFAAQGPDPTQPDHVYAGESYTVSYTVTNTGLGDTPASQSKWEDDIYLAPDQILDASDYYVGTVEYMGGLASKSNYTISMSFVAPSNMIGSWYVFVITNPPTPGKPGGAVTVSAENNATSTQVPLIIE